MERLKQLGIGSIVFDPCADLPADGDFLISVVFLRLGRQGLRAAQGAGGTQQSANHTSHNVYYVKKPAEVHLLN